MSKVEGLPEFPGLVTMAEEARRRKMEYHTFRRDVIAGKIPAFRVGYYVLIPTMSVDMQRVNGGLRFSVVCSGANEKKTRLTVP